MQLDSNNTQSQEIDVLKIMRDIRADIAVKGYVDDIPEFNPLDKPCNKTTNEFDLKILNDNIVLLEDTWNIAPYQAIGTRKGFIGRIILFIKTIIRKCIDFHVTPIVLDQNEYNRVMLDSLKLIRDYISLMNE